MILLKNLVKKRRKDLSLHWVQLNKYNVQFNVKYLKKFKLIKDFKNFILISYEQIYYFLNGDWRLNNQ